MKAICTLIIGFAPLLSMLFLFTCATHAQTGKMSSVYTTLRQKDCKKIDNPDLDDDVYNGLCPGVGGYMLEVVEGDGRSMMIVRSPKGGYIDLRLDEAVSQAFSWFGEKAEWRVAAKEPTKPVALIFRFETSQPDHPTQPGNRSFLVVVKLTSTDICVTNAVEPGRDQNQRARELADTAGQQPCIKN